MQNEAGTIPVLVLGGLHQIHNPVIDSLHSKLHQPYFKNNNMGMDVVEVANTMGAKVDKNWLAGQARPGEVLRG